MDTDAFSNLMQVLPNMTKMGQENVEIKKQNQQLNQKIIDLISENNKIKAKYQALKNEILQKDCKIKQQKIKIKELKKKKKNQAPRQQSCSHTSSSHATTDDDSSTVSPPPQLCSSQLVEPQSDDHDDLCKLLAEINCENEKNLFPSTENITTKKKKSEKRPKILPKPISMPEILRKIRETDCENMDKVVSFVLAQSFLSLPKMKQQYVQILNTLSTTLRITPLNSPDIHQLATFFVKFALMISPKSLETFKQSVSNRELASFVSAIEDTLDIDIECS